MMNLYLDRGLKTDNKDGVATVAGAVFRLVEYKRFVRPWNRMLDGWEASAFHATDFYSGYGEFRRDTSSRKERFESDSASIASERRYFEGFACFHESGDKGGAEVARTVELMRRDPKTGPHIQVRSFAQVNKGVARGLEAADFLAWHWNKYYMDKFRVGNENHARKDFAALLRIAEEKIYLTLIVGDKLKYFLDLAPKD